MTTLRDKITTHPNHTFSIGFNYAGIFAIYYNLGDSTEEVGRSSRTWGAFEVLETPDGQFMELQLMVDQARADYMAKQQYKAANCKYEDAAEGDKR